jgi:hypothetical protein
MFVLSYRIKASTLAIRKSTTLQAKIAKELAFFSTRIYTLLQTINEKKDPRTKN